MLVIVVPAAMAQSGSLSSFDPLSSGQQGIHLYSANLYSGYYSAGGPVGPGMAIQGPVQTPMTTVTGSLTIGGSRMGENSEFTWSYSPSYFNTLYGGGVSSHGSLNHTGGASWVRKLGNSGKWSMSASVNMLLMDMLQLYAGPATAESAGGASLAGGTASSALLTSEQAYLYGNRVLDASSNLVLTWAPSTRTTAALTLSGTRMQSLGGGTVMEGAAAPPLQKSTDARASLNLKHSLSPRTQIGIDVTTDRMFSALEQGYASGSSLSLSRMLTQHWFAEVTGGVGKTVYTSHANAVTENIQYLGGANIGFKSFSNTVVFAYDRSLGDVYGLGSASTTSATGTWTWKRPGSAWSISGNGGLQQLDNMSFRNTLSWRGGASINRRIAPHVFLTLQYTYLQFPGELKVAGMQVSDNGVIASMTWSPSTYR